MFFRLRRVIHRTLLRPLTRWLFHLQVDGELDLSGPAIVVANHNSHIDTAVLMAAFPTSRLDLVRPVAAADYFLRNRLLAWFSTRIVGILPLDRHRTSNIDPLAGASDSLRAGEILLLFPEGTRGEPGVFADLKPGVARLAARHPDVPIIPVWLDGCERAMPKGLKFPRSAWCRVAVGSALPSRVGESAGEFLVRLRQEMLTLAEDRRIAA